VDHYARAYRIFSRIRGYRRFEEMLHSLRRFGKDEVAKERHRILRFYDIYGEKATKEAFSVDRKLIHVWRKRLRANDGHLEALIPQSTRPIKVRRMNIDPRIIQCIRQMRQEHPGMGKEKLKPFVDKHCKEAHIPCVSESTIGKIIKRHKFFYQSSGKVYHDPGSRWMKEPRSKPKRLRVVHAPKHEEFGHFQADSSVKFLDGIRRYMISAIDSTLKFSFSSCYSHLNSRAARDFLRRLEIVYPLSIKSLQTDNGAEFLGEFDAYLKHKGIPHYFTYPRCPKINGCVERFNRTLKEEFINHNLHLIDDLPRFRETLVDYLIFYNTERPHKALGLKSPLDYLISKEAMSKKIATRTIAGIFPLTLIQ
jgi:transposase InsO family protein